MKQVDLNTATQVIQALEVAYSGSTGSPDNPIVPVSAAAGATPDTVIDFIVTAHARELVVVAYATVAMTMLIELVTIEGIPDVVAATVPLLAVTATRTTVTGLTVGARVRVNLVGAIPGNIRAVAYARA